jgi:hypothetical protein
MSEPRRSFAASSLLGAVLLASTLLGAVGCATFAPLPTTPRLQALTWSSYEMMRVRKR